MRPVDTPTAADFFCGGGGASEGVISAGVELRFAANHDAVAIATHAHRHPGVDHYQVDLVDYDVAKMPRVQMAHFSPSCVHHSQANANKVYEQPATLFDYLNGAATLEPEARSGYASSERSRVTMSCVLRYADAHRPDLMIVENVVEAAKWGPNRNGDTFQWWLGQLHNCGYRTKPLMLNSAAFGVPQMRDRMFVMCWRNGMRTPDLQHRVNAWCARCDRVVEARQVFRRRTKPWPLAEWGKLGQQYDYRCTHCHHVTQIAYTPASTVIDWDNLGIRIGDRDRPLAARTLERIQRGIDAYGGRLPFVYDYQGPPTGIGQPLTTLTTTETHAVAGMQLVAAGNTFQRPGSTCRTRSLNEPTWTQHTTASVGIATVEGAVVPFRQHTRPTRLAEPVPTQTAQQVAGLALWPAGAMFAKNNGNGNDTRYHPTSDPFLTLTSRDTTSLASIERPGPVAIDDVRFRMLTVDEIRRTMAYPDDWKAVGPDPTKPPSKQDQVRLLGDGVTPPVLTWCTQRALDIAA
jgi:DNA (cytosine-5)-methyltransferase 1